MCKGFLVLKAGLIIVQPDNKIILPIYDLPICFYGKCNSVNRLFHIINSPHGLVRNLKSS